MSGWLLWDGTLARQRSGTLASVMKILAKVTSRRKSGGLGETDFHGRNRGSTLVARQHGQCAFDAQVCLAVAACRLLVWRIEGGS
ncbi:hypothetical protein J7413_15525 [Shimia sp. R10_1]|uniref:hypothetical protein n=1 Tax=Shimia sp. R10_1 TaxID=2821095 RepID=UPI001ADAC167|nr:hypothetical protein [Shimia sp. R10_1]MBO9474957.1 hypothetical protein [Shimia sp. R10_1]